MLLLALALCGCRQEAPRDLRAECGQNQRKLAWALQAYANDNGGRYPAAAGRYLSDLARCPSNGAEYYVATAGSRFTIVCQGVHP